jgi:type I restriction enzyme, S subunit
MKNGWQTKTLGDLFDITSSKRVFEADWKTEGVPFYRAREIVKLARHGFVENELFISEEMFDRYSTKYGIPAEGDIMVTGVGTLGICYVVKKEDRFYFKDGNIIWLKKKTEADSRFVEYAFQSDYLRSQIDDSVGATVGTYTIIKAKSTRIPVPPLPEQQRIVGILDEAFGGIAIAKANAVKNLQNARAIFESHLQSVFTQRGDGWTEKPLGTLASFRNGINYTKDSKGERIKIVGVRNFQKNFSAPLDDLDTVTIDGELSELDSLKQDDILAVRSNGNIELIGRCILVGEVTEKISHSGFTIRIRVSNGEVVPRYLCHFMKSASSRKRLTDGGTGTNIKSLNQGMLSAFAIPFPPISVQNVLVEKLESLSEESRRLESIYQRKVAALEALKKSLLHQAFTGAL